MSCQCDWSLFLILIMATNCNSTRFVNKDRNSTVEVCKNGCLSKCCPNNQILLKQAYKNNCVKNPFGLSVENYTEVDIYGKDIIQEVKKTKKTLQNFIFMYSDTFNKPMHIVLNSEDVFMVPSKKVYILENGTLAVRSLNHLRQWEVMLSHDVFCVELQLDAETDDEPDRDTLKLVIRILLRPTDLDQLPRSTSRQKDTITAYAMLVSCFFLLLVLLAYVLLPQKRNLPSLMVMAYVASLGTAFLFRAVQVLKDRQLTKNECIFVGLVLYFSMLSSFTWTNVMSFDLWSSMSKPRPTRAARRKTLAKFCHYSQYGFGVPLLMTLFVVVIDYADLTSIPSFVKPHFVAEKTSCFFQIEEESQLYMNGPILVTTVINSAFFVLTARYIWRNSAPPGGSGDSRNTKKDKQRFIVYLKLTQVMGINWILDVAGILISPDSWVWCLADIYNSFLGVFIFIIFICKENMIVLLCKRFSVETDLLRKWESSLDTSASVPNELQTTVPLKKSERGVLHQTESK